MRQVIALLTILQTVASYRVAYVEHHAGSACGSGVCGAATKKLNVAAYTQYAQTASSQGASLIVFPEYGITGESNYPMSSWVQGGYTEQFGAAQNRVNPCTAQGWARTAPSVAALSCAAAKSKIAIVANLAEYSADEKLMYNVDVVFDTDGALIAKYRKMNLWGEASYMSVPKDCQVVSFSTSFNQTFGLFTCADLIYNFPADHLISQAIDQFIVPSAWSDEMAQVRRHAGVQQR